MNDNKEFFIKEVKTAVESTRCTYSDAIVSFHEKHKVEIETVAAWVKKDQGLKAALLEESIRSKTVRSSD
jgi:hypothetical protein